MTLHVAHGIVAVVVTTLFATAATIQPTISDFTFFNPTTTITTTTTTITTTTTVETFVSTFEVFPISP